jgi:hypothetical protein
MPELTPAEWNSCDIEALYDHFRSLTDSELIDAIDNAVLNGFGKDAYRVMTMELLGRFQYPYRCKPSRSSHVK